MCYFCCKEKSEKKKKEGNDMLYALVITVILSLIYGFNGFEQAVITGLILLLAHLYDIKKELINKR